VKIRASSDPFYTHYIQCDGIYSKRVKEMAEGLSFAEGRVEAFGTVVYFHYFEDAMLFLLKYSGERNI
jgi:hypothetical protein